MRKPLGQDKTIELFSALIEKGRLSHAYLFEGEEGMGKKTLAYHIIKLMVCDANRACGRCNSCMCVDSEAHPDIIRISNGDKQTIGIDKIRELGTKVFEKPVMGRYKAVVIENAHLLTKEAQNAMLKLIEEPPHYAVFMLLCNSTSKILKTVLSRVTCINMKPLSHEQLKEVAGDAPEFMYKYCRGNAGELIRLKSDDAFYELRNNTFKMLELMLTKDSYCIYDAIGLLAADKVQFLRQTDVLISFFRDCVMKSLGSDSLITNLDVPDKADNFLGYTGKNKTYKFMKLIEITLNTQKEILRNGNMTITKHTMLMKYWEVINDNSNRCTL